jgi:2-dehydropantoate 2-reductase
MRDRGLRIESPLGNLNLPKVNATDNPAEVGPVDIVAFTVKLYDSESAIGMLPALIGPQTLVIPFQNGVDSVQMLTRAIGRTHVVGGTTYVACVVAEPGVIRHTAMNRLIFGPLDASQASRLEVFAEACRHAGIDTTLSDRVNVEIWTKFARLSVFSGMTAITRCPIGPIVDDPDLFAMAEAALHESIAVARCKQIPLAHSLFTEIVDSLKALPPQTKSSLLQDLEGGRRLELPWLSGAVVRIGQEVGVETPVHRFIATVLKPHVGGRAH